LLWIFPPLNSARVCMISRMGVIFQILPWLMRDGTCRRLVSSHLSWFHWHISDIWFFFLYKSWIRIGRKIINWFIHSRVMEKFYIYERESRSGHSKLFFYIFFSKLFKDFLKSFLNFYKNASDHPLHHDPTQCRYERCLTGR
jgi:hypothetical protein